MANLHNIVYLSEAQLAELIANGSVTIGGQTVIYSADDIYITPMTAKNVLQNIGTYVSGNTVALDVNSVNLDTAVVTPTRVPLPLADTTHAGLMSKEDKAALDLLIAERQG